MGKALCVQALNSWLHNALTSRTEMDLGERCYAHQHPSLDDPVMLADQRLPVALTTLHLCRRPESGIPPASRRQYVNANAARWTIRSQTYVTSFVTSGSTRRQFCISQQL